MNIGDKNYQDGAIPLVLVNDGDALSFNSYQYETL